MVTRKRFSALLALLAAVAISAQLSPAHSDDYNPPSWRGQPGTTVQEWEFNTPFLAGPDGSLNNNPYGQPIASGNGAWFPLPGSRPGWWGLGYGESIQFTIPNQPLPNPQKLIRVQATLFKGVPEVRAFNLPPATPQNITTDPDGFISATWEFVLPVNPPFEVITITNTSTAFLGIDQVVIDTWCVPEPGTFTALGVGLMGFAPLLRRRR